MDLTEQFKQDFRTYLIELLNQRPHIFVSTTLLRIDGQMSYNDDKNVLFVPIPFGRQIMDFIREEGLSVIEHNSMFYSVSLAG